MAMAMIMMTMMVMTMNARDGDGRDSGGSDGWDRVCVCVCSCVCVCVCEALPVAIPDQARCVEVAYTHTMSSMPIPFAEALRRLDEESKGSSIRHCPRPAPLGIPRPSPPDGRAG